MIDVGSRELALVPDTNALYANPALEEWEGDAAATLVFTPMVIQELDRHKSQHPRESVRRKALSLTTRIEEFRRRGDIVAGVPLAGSLRFRVIPFEPGEDDAESWMRLDDADDRIIAAALGVGRREPNTAVVFITKDANLRTKAQLAGLPLDEPPPSSKPEVEPAGDRPARNLPDVMVGHPGANISLGDAADIGAPGKRRLIKVEPRYPIENKGMSSIRDVTTGVRARDGQEHEFGGHRAQLIAAGEVSWVDHVGSLPDSWLKEIHESVGADGFIYWARFSDRDGLRWEVAYDASTRTTEWAKLPVG